MLWQVTATRKAAKALAALPRKVQERFAFLVREIEEKGPVRGAWPNYGRLGENRHHCHLKKGRPTYVAVWEVRNNKIRLVEVTYVGTHEKAPY